MVFSVLFEAASLTESLDQRLSIPSNNLLPQINLEPKLRRILGCFKSTICRHIHSIDPTRAVRGQKEDDRSQVVRGTGPSSSKHVRVDPFVAKQKRN